MGESYEHLWNKVCTTNPAFCGWRTKLAHIFWWDSPQRRKLISDFKKRKNSRMCTSGSGIVLSTRHGTLPINVARGSFSISWNVYRFPIMGWKIIFSTKMFLQYKSFEMWYFFAAFEYKINVTFKGKLYRLYLPTCFHLKKLSNHRTAWINIKF